MNCPTLYTVKYGPQSVDTHGTRTVASVHGLNPVYETPLLGENSV
jgi:hypothetical protein